MSSLQWLEANPNLLLSHTLMFYSLCGRESLSSEIYGLLKSFLAFILIYLQSRHICGNYSHGLLCRKYARELCHF